MSILGPLITAARATTRSSKENRRLSEMQMMTMIGVREGGARLENVGLDDSFSRGAFLAIFPSLKNLFLSVWAHGHHTCIGPTMLRDILGPESQLRPLL